MTSSSILFIIVIAIQFIAAKSLVPIRKHSGLVYYVKSAPTPTPNFPSSPLLVSTVEKSRRMSQPDRRSTANIFQVLMSSKAGGGGGSTKLDRKTCEYIEFWYFYYLGLHYNENT